jgi:hypothetical protein
MPTKAPNTARQRGITPVIPHKADEKKKPSFLARTLYKARVRIDHRSAEALRAYCPTVLEE